MASLVRQRLYVHDIYNRLMEVVRIKKQYMNVLLFYSELI